MGYLLTIDAGTGSGRAVLFDENGNQVSVGQEEWTHNSDPKYPNSMDFDFNKNWDLICRCIKKAISDADINSNEILAVSASSMREGIVLYDKDGKELWAVANVDARASVEVKELKEKFPNLEEKFYKISGQTFALGALPRIMWVKNNKPNIYEKTKKISMISDWVLAKLSNEIVTDPSNGGTTGIYSLEERDWTPYMAKEIGLKDDIFPPSIEAGEVVGEVTSQASKQSGLTKGCKVVMGGGDVQLGCAGLGVVNTNEVAVLGGTFWQQLVNMNQPLTPNDMSIRVNPHVIKGVSQAEGITFFSGLIMRWFRDAFCQSEKEIAKARGIDTYSVLEEMASSVPVGSHGIMPTYSDEMNYGKWYHASPSLLNLNLDPLKCGKAEIFRALQENACIVTANNLDKIFAFTGVDTDTLVFAAGASKGNLWCQILSDVTGKKIKVPVVKEATALGGAMASGVGVGIYSSMQEASKLVQWEKSYEPNMTNNKTYKEIREKWAKAYKAQLKLVDDGVTNSMWKAPGL